MKKTIYIAIAIIALCSCDKKKESSTIITTVDTTEVVRQDTIDMGDRSTSRQVTWDDATYTVSITRKADKSLKKANDSNGNTYYDNAVTVVINGPQGTVLNRTFHKSDFQSHIDPQYIKPEQSVLSSIAYKDLSDGTLKLVASVGSPDEMDDNYMLVQISIDKHGSCTLKRIDENEE